MKETPRPWWLNKVEEGSEEWQRGLNTVICGGDGFSKRTIAEIPSSKDSADNAELILKAVNSFDDMLEALEGLLKNAPAPKGIKQDYSYILYREAAKKAISKAKGELTP